MDNLPVPQPLSFIVEIRQDTGDSYLVMCYEKNNITPHYLLRKGKNYEARDIYFKAINRLCESNYWRKSVSGPYQYSLYRTVIEWCGDFKKIYSIEGN